MIYFAGRALKMGIDYLGNIKIQKMSEPGKNKVTLLLILKNVSTLEKNDVVQKKLKLKNLKTYFIGQALR